jgi:hypothetical protein
MGDDLEIVGEIPRHQVEAHDHGHRLAVELRMAPVVIDRHRHPQAEGRHERRFDQEHRHG